MFKQLLFYLFIHFTSSSKPIRIPLTGNDWIIEDNLNHTVQGTIPGTIHTILLAANHIPDPYKGSNDVDLRYLIKNNWVFSKTFNVSSDVLASNETFLHLEQIDTVATITLNSCPVGRTNSMFMRYVFEIIPGCFRSYNELQIHFESPINYAFNQSIAYNDTVPPNCTALVQNGECHVQFIRKEQCSFSWDWGPAFAPIGIPGDIYIEAVNRTDIIILLETVNLIGYDKDKKNWQIDVLLTSLDSPFTSKLKFVLENTTWSYETSSLFNHTLTISLLIPIENVLLWWPNGYGNQPLYQLTIFNNDQIIDARVLGFRTVELIQDSYSEGINGTSFYFRINSIPIYIKGSNWIPPDAFQERVTDEKLELLLNSTKIANMNMLRVWGGGIYERRLFYQLADRLGIMLWHDFMFACSLYPIDEEFLQNVHNEIIFQVKRLQHHPSIVLWSGNNENEQAIAQNWWNIPIEKLNKTKDDYRKLYVETVMNSLKQIDQGLNRPFVISSPSNGQETIRENYIATNPQDPLYGDVHFYDFKEDSWNFTIYPIARFISETGVQSLPSLDTWYQITNDTNDLNLNSSFMLHREHSDNQLTSMLNYIKNNLPLPITTDSLKYFSYIIYLSQIHQAMTLKTISDLSRIHASKDMINPKTSQGHTMGLMYWQINDIWQAPTWSTIEYNLKWKMGHYYAKHMYTPIYIIAILTPYLADINDENAKISIYMTNEISNNTYGVITCGVYTLDSFNPRIMFGDDISFDTPGLKPIVELKYSSLMKQALCTDNSQCLIHCSYISRQQPIRQTLFLNRPKNYKLLNPNLKIENITQASPNDFNFVVIADVPAIFVWLDVSENITGYFSRNGFNIFERTTILSFHSWKPITNLIFRPIISLFDITQS